MKTIQIPIPKGYEIDTFDLKTGEVKLKETPKDITERIKTFDDVLDSLNIDRNHFNDYINGMTSKGLHTDEIAYLKLKKVAEALNEGWTPDWTDSNQYKYYPWFKMGSASGVGFSFGGCDGWISVSLVGSRLCFKSAKLAKYAGKQFEAIYKDFITLNS